MLRHTVTDETRVDGSFREALLLDKEGDFLTRRIEEELKKFKGKERRKGEDALALANSLHSDQKRVDGTPYVNHILRVGARLMVPFELPPDADLACAHSFTTASRTRAKSSPR